MIKPISYRDTIPFQEQAIRHNLIFRNDVDYIGYFIHNELVGIAATENKKNKTILRSAFVCHSYRGQGIYHELVKYRMIHAKHKTIEMTCTKMSLPYHLKRGATIIREFKNYTKVKYENIS